MSIFKNFRSSPENKTREFNSFHDNSESVKIR